MLKAEDFFDLQESPFFSLFDHTAYVWEGLNNLKNYIRENLSGNAGAIRKGETLVRKTLVLYDNRVIDAGFEIDTSDKQPRVTRNGSVLEGASIIYAGAALMDDAIYIGKNTVVEPGALIKGPAIILDHTEIRQGAYIRGHVLVGKGCVVGHATEIKSSVMLGGSKAGHFAYIGDSILGKVNLGAGTKLANLKLMDRPITVKAGGETYETGLKKFGAILGDGVETGCNSVTTPGTLLGRNVLLYPNGTARGYCPPGKVIQIRQSKKILDTP